MAKKVLSPRNRRPPREIGPSLHTSQKRDAFFRNVIDPRALLHVFDSVPGTRYFVKDGEGRLMATSRETVRRLGFESEDQLLGKLPHEFLPKDLADKYHADDCWVLKHRQPLLNIIEINFSEQRVREWTVVNKYPLLDAQGKVVGIVGLIRTLEDRHKLLANLGPVGRAADHIGEHLGDRLLLLDIADHVGVSERQLQRLFRRVFSMSVQQFVIQSRVHAAIQELINSDRSIAEIALNLGFADQSAFTHSFRKVVGMPPREYRRKHLDRIAPTQTRD